jgi:hypothetical protein
MSNQKKITQYVSEIDQFLEAFDQSHTQLSKSQQREQEKYRRIYLLRDDPISSDPSEVI